MPLFAANKAAALCMLRPMLGTGLPFSELAGLEAAGVIGEIGVLGEFVSSAKSESWEARRAQMLPMMMQQRAGRLGGPAKLRLGLDLNAATNIFFKEATAAAAAAATAAAAAAAAAHIC